MENNGALGFGRGVVDGVLAMRLSLLRLGVPSISEDALFAFLADWDNKNGVSIINT